MSIRHHSNAHRTSAKARLAVAGAAVLVMTLAGCSAPATPAAPSSTPTATPTPSATAVPATAASVVIGGLSISALDAEGTVLDSAPYLGDAETAMDLLNKAFQTFPVLTERVTDSSCEPDAAIATWGDSFVLEYDKEFGAPWGTFDAIATGPAVGDVAITTPTGQGIGSALADLEASIPGVHIVGFGDTGISQVHYDVGDGEFVAPDSPDAIMTDYWGAAAASEGGTITSLRAPQSYYDFC